MRPDEVAKAMNGYGDPPGDVADQAERLAMIMEAEAIHAGLNGGGGEVTLDLPYPLEDVNDVITEEDFVDDASDDPLHTGGFDVTDTIPAFVTAEEAAMHVVDGDDPTDRPYFEDGATVPPPSELTPEDETLLGIDPYDGTS